MWLLRACDCAVKKMVRIGGPSVARPGASGPPKGSGTKTLSYRNSMMSLMRYHESNYVRELKRFVVYPRTEYVTGEVDQLQDDSGVEQLAGVRTLRRFEDLLENGYEFRRSHFQRGFCDYVLPSLAPNLMGPSDWERAGPQVIKQKGWLPKDLSKVKMVTCHHE